MNSKVKNLTVISMFAALSFALVAMIRIPFFAFLSYEPKDIMIAIAGFILGPLASAAISVTVSLIEMVTISTTGFPGCVMNILAGCSFSCTAAFIYKRRRTVNGAVIGLLCGCAVMTGVMLLWNFLITPIYMNVPRSQVVSMLIPVFLPFNLIKSGINTAVILLVYKPVVTALRKTGMIKSDTSESKKLFSAGTLILGGVLLITCVMIALVINKVI